jgi:SNF2 family DNA or RNA helicase
LIVPVPLKTQWQREWLDTTGEVPLAVVDGQKPERDRLYRQTKSGFLIIHYEQLLRDLELVQRFAPELVVLDEAQRIKNWTTKSHAYVTSLQPEWRLVLTGTPLENRLEELASLLDWVDDTALAPKWRLPAWHTEWSAEGSGERVGIRNLGTLRQRVSHCLLRRIRREVLQQLPPRTDVRVPVEMTEQQREEHDACSVPIAQLMRVAQRRPLRAPEFLKLMQLLAQQRIISNGLAQQRFDEVWPVYSQAVADDALLSTSGSPKLIEFRRVLSDLALTQGRKVVVFSQWRKMLRLAHWAVQGLLEAQGLRAVFFTGEESQRTRTQNVADFHEDASVRVMFLSDAGGVGLNLQHAASACINLELPWNPAVLEQRVGRIYRLGQTQPIDVLNLVTEYGIEARIAGLIATKEALFTGLFDGTTDSVRFDAPSSFVKDLERLVEHVELPPGDPEGAVESLEVDAAGLDADTAPLEAAPSEPTAAESMAARGEPSPAPDAAPAGALPATRVEALFERIQVTRLENGGLRLEAEPEAAEELARLLQGLASLLSASGKAPPA